MERESARDKMRDSSKCIYAGESFKMPQSLRDELGFTEFGTAEQYIAIYKKVK